MRRQSGITRQSPDRWGTATSGTTGLLRHVVVATTDGRELVLPRHTAPEAEPAMILATLGLALPAPPPSRVGAVMIEFPAAASQEVL